MNIEYKVFVFIFWGLVFGNLYAGYGVSPDRNCANLSPYQGFTRSRDLICCDSFDTKVLVGNASFVHEEYSNELVQESDGNFDGCDVIVCLNGDEISAKVIEIGINEIKYRRCDNIDGPLIIIPKSEVLMIKYSNGSKDLINTIQGQQRNTNNRSGGSSGASSHRESQKDSNNTASASLGLGLLSSFGFISPFFFLASISAIILGIIALNNESKYPGRYRKSSRLHAILGIVLGGLSLIGIAIIFGLLLI